MTQHQKFAGYTTIAATVTSILLFVVNKADIQGLLFFVILLLAVLSGFVTLALFVSSLTKKPAKTFDKIMNVFDLLLIWP